MYSAVHTSNESREKKTFLNEWRGESNNSLRERWCTWSFPLKLRSILLKKFTNPTTTFTDGLIIRLQCSDSVYKSSGQNDRTTTEESEVTQSKILLFFPSDQIRCFFRLQANQRKTLLCLFGSLHSLTHSLFTPKSRTFVVVVVSVVLCSFVSLFQSRKRSSWLNWKTLFSTEGGKHRERTCRSRGAPCLPLACFSFTVCSDIRELVAGSHQLRLVDRDLFLSFLRGSVFLSLAT